MGSLLLVATPIGNLEDITIRALETLRNVRLIAAEDTRHTQRLLQRYDIKTPTTSYFEHNKLAKLDRILDYLREGDVALVSDAGMPAISDPGYELVRAAIEAGHNVSVIPGPSAFVSALAISGLPTDGFLYLGFLPRRQSERLRLFGEVASERRTLVFYEAPHRMSEALSDAKTALGDRQTALVAELTKLHERVIRGCLSELIERLAEAPARGEYTVVVAGAVAVGKADDAEVIHQIEALVATGLGAKEVASRVALATGRGRREVYRLLLALGKCDTI